MYAASRQAKGYVYGSLESTASLTDVLTLKVDILRASAVLPPLVLARTTSYPSVS